MITCNRLKELVIIAISLLVGIGGLHVAVDICSATPPKSLNEIKAELYKID